MTYETVVHGFFNAINFGTPHFHTPSNFGGIHVGIYALDYLDKTAPNILPYGKVRKQNHRMSDSLIDNCHFNVNSVEVTKKAHEIAHKDYLAYMETRETFKNVDKDVQESPLFEMCAFLLNANHTNVYIAAHYSSR